MRCTAEFARPKASMSYVTSGWLDVPPVAMVAQYLLYHS